MSLDRNVISKASGVGRSDMNAAFGVDLARCIVRRAYANGSSRRVAGTGSQRLSNPLVHSGLRP